MADVVPAADGIYAGISDEVYHGDHSSLSSSGARKILATTPARFRWEQLNGRPPTKAFDVGHAFHTETLGTGPGIVVPHDPKAKNPHAWQTDEAKRQVAEARAAGQVPLKPDEAAAVAAMVEAVRTHPLAGRLFASGAPEQSIWWTDPATGARLRCRPDWLTEVLGEPVVVDLKSTEDASPQAWRKTAANYGYHVQDPYYRDGLEAIGLGPADFVFVLVEKSPPYLVATYRLTAEDVALGRARARRGIDLYARCLESGEWPGYALDFVEIPLPAWTAA